MSTSPTSVTYAPSPSAPASIVAPSESTHVQHDIAAMRDFLAELVSAGDIVDLRLIDGNRNVHGGRFSDVDRIPEVIASVCGDSGRAYVAIGPPRLEDGPADNQLSQSEDAIPIEPRLARIDRVAIHACCLPRPGECDANLRVGSPGRDTRDSAVSMRDCLLSLSPTLRAASRKGAGGQAECVVVAITPDADPAASRSRMESLAGLLRSLGEAHDRHADVLVNTWLPVPGFLDRGELSDDTHPPCRVTLDPDGGVVPLTLDALQGELMTLLDRQKAEQQQSAAQQFASVAWVVPGARVRMADRETGTVTSVDGRHVLVQTDGTGRWGPRISMAAADQLVSLDQEAAAEAAELEAAEIIDRWPRMRPEAFHGIAGEVVRLADPHTEADPAAVLIQFLVATANMLGRGPHFRVGGTEHHLSLFAAVVGTTGASRKGTGMDVIRYVLSPLDKPWTETRVQGGLVSGEGLIHHVRDRRFAEKEVSTGKSPHKTKHIENVMVDAGVADKRLLLVETELARVIKVMAREGNTLSSVIRQAWDGLPLRVMGKAAGESATGSHISIVGHVTDADLSKFLATEDIANGFGNRFLWIAAKRSKLLPGGGDLPSVDWEPVRQAICDVRAFIRNPQGGPVPLAADLPNPSFQLGRDAEADALWISLYPELSAGKPGLLGKIVGRAEAQVMRLAVAFAVLDRSATVGVVHLEAALAVWDFCAASARYIFGEAHADPVTEKLLAALKAAPDCAGSP